jgi:AdoMet-dependent rRNA methyltransferase SPB1
MRKVRGLEDDKEEKPESKAAKDEEEEEEDEETKLLGEVDLLRKKAAARDKRSRRKEREKKAKYQRRIDLKMENPDDVLAVPEELGLFSLRQIQTAAGLSAVSDGTEQADAYAAAASESDEETEEEEESDEEESEAEEERRRRRVEKELDQLYESYCERTGVKTKQAKQGLKARRAADQELLSQAGQGAAFIPEPSFVPDLTRGVDDDDDDEGEGEAGAGRHPLLDDLGADQQQRTAEAEAEQAAARLWFDQVPHTHRHTQTRAHGRARARTDTRGCGSTRCHAARTSEQ